MNAKLRILFADDELFLYRALVEILEEEGHVVVPSHTDATQILAKLGANVIGDDDAEGPHLSMAEGPPYDLIVLDMMMPVGTEGAPGGMLAQYGFFDAGLGVYKLLRRGTIKGLEWAQDVPVFVLTGNNDIEIRKGLRDCPGSEPGHNLLIEYKPSPGTWKKIVDFGNAARDVRRASGQEVER